MRGYDAVVVGGGPAGSSCARALVRAGAKVLVLDRAAFPRLKLCAGWITPAAIAALDFDPAAYPHRFNTFERIVVHIKGLVFPYPEPQHSIRRTEFDHYLLERCGAEVAVHDVKDIRRDGDGYVIDGAIRGDYLVGAGGTRCPVFRRLFRAENPRAAARQIATYEYEFPYEWTDHRCHLWFFVDGLPGYTWYVPKRDGYLNVGVGGVAEKLKAGAGDIKSHWRRFAARLRSRGLIDGAELSPKGYSYYLRDKVDVIRMDNAFIAGDAVGLATRDLGEGIGPAIESGILAAKAITEGADYSLAAVGALSVDRWWMRMFV